MASVTASVRTFTVQADITKPGAHSGRLQHPGPSNTPGSIASGTGVGSWSGLTLTKANSGTNQDNCKNLASLQIDYTAN